MPTVPLTDTTVRNAKPAAKPSKLYDGKGLFLLVTPNGGKWWRLKYRFNNKEKLLSLGTYPDVSLELARQRRDNARGELASGNDPSAVKASQKIEALNDAASTFEAVAGEWLSKRPKNLASSTLSKYRMILKNDLLPWLGKRPLKEITTPEVLRVIRRVESRGANELAHRAMWLARKVFQYAISEGRLSSNPAVNLTDALEPVVVKHHAAITEPKQVAELLRAIDGYTGTFTVKCAMQIAPLLFVRPGELRQAEWAEIDLDKAEWNIPAERMKMRLPHLVPLSTQAVSILRELHPLTGHGRFVFPSMRTGERAMSDNTVNAALRRLGYSADEMTGHGFRAMARTILDEVMGMRPDFIEHQMAHAVKDPNGRAYNRTSHLPERRKMMQQWSDYMDKLKTGADIVPINSKVA